MNEKKKLRSQGLNKQIKGVLFDVDGTLYHQTPVRITMAILIILTNILKPRSLQKHISVINAFRQAQEHLRLNSPGAANCKRLQFELAAKLTNQPMEVVKDIVEEWFFRRPLPFLPYCNRKKVHTTLESLLTQGIKLGVFSDYPTTEKLKALGLSQYFSFALSAWDKEMSGFKPHTNGFNIAAERMDLHPDEILYVGDRAKVDGTGAHLAGMSCAIIGNKKLRQQDGTLFIKYLPDLQMLL